MGDIQFLLGDTALVDNPDPQDKSTEVLITQAWNFTLRVTVLPSVIPLCSTLVSFIHCYHILPLYPDLEVSSHVPL